MSGRVGVLVMAHGTPAAPAEIAAFYTRIRRGRPPTLEQLEELEGRYAAIGGVSPLAERSRREKDKQKPTKKPLHGRARPSGECASRSPATCAALAPCPTGR